MDGAVTGDKTQNTMAKRRGHSPEDDGDLAVDENRENGSRRMKEEDEDHDGGAAAGGRKKRKKNKKERIGLMASSGQTDAERRVLRRRLRNLKDAIVMGGDATTRGGDGEDGEEDAGGDCAGERDLDALREENNDANKNVRFTREAVLDADNVELITEKSLREAEKSIQVSSWKSRGWHSRFDSRSSHWRLRLT